MVVNLLATYVKPSCPWCSIDGLAGNQRHSVGERAVDVHQLSVVWRGDIITFSGHRNVHECVDTCGVVASFLVVEGDSVVSEVLGIVTSVLVVSGALVVARFLVVGSALVVTTGFLIIGRVLVIVIVVKGNSTFSIGFIVVSRVLVVVIGVFFFVLFVLFIFFVFVFFFFFFLFFFFLLFFFNRASIRALGAFAIVVKWNSTFTIGALERRGGGNPAGRSGVTVSTVIALFSGRLGRRGVNLRIPDIGKTCES